MKKPTRVKTATTKNIELNRWCIEMAMRWPVVSTYGNSGGAYGGSLGGSRMDSDADVIGRANKIMAWITAAH